MKVFLTRRIRQIGLDMIQQAGHTVTIWENKAVPTPTEFVEICKEHDAIVVADRNRVNQEFLEAVPHLKVIALHSIGYNHVDLATAKRLNIPIGNTPNAGSEATADTAFMLMLTASKNAFYMYQSIKRGEWSHFTPTENLGIGLRNKVLGIFGLGNIGFEMARLSRAAYNMEIIYHNRSRNERAEKELGAKWVSFEELLSQSDVLSVHAALNEQTENKFDATAFSKMKKNSIFINTSRGQIHDELALTEVLKSRTIWGAGLDVTNPEPMIFNNELLDLPHVSITPHIGSSIEEDRDKMAKMVAENILAGLAGEKLPYEV